MQNRQIALAMARGLAPTASNIQRIAKETDDESAAWAFTQWKQRERAARKFSRADEMLYVAEALEQATHEEVARYRASRFPEGVLVADLTCGIGGDLIALAYRGPATGYEIDHERSVCARHNLAALGLDADVVEQDSLSAGPFPYAVCDPARRVGGKRTLDIADFEPNPYRLAELLAQSKLGCMKLSPMLTDQCLEALSPSIEFISFGKECREAMLWFGGDAEPGRWAVRIETLSRLEACPSPAAAVEPGRYLYEADPAAIRAHCLGTLCRQLGLAPLGDSNGYLTGSEPMDSEWLTAFEVIEGSLDSEKAVLQWLRSNNAKLASIKTRGVDLDPSATMKRLKTAGERAVELAVYRAGGKNRYVVIKR